MVRFTIRDVLWLTVVVALGVGWWLESSEPKALLVTPREVSELCGPDEQVKITVYRVGWNADSPDGTRRIGARLIGR